MLKRHLLTFMSVSLFLTNQTHARIVFLRASGRLLANIALIMLKSVRNILQFVERGQLFAQQL